MLEQVKLPLRVATPHRPARTSSARDDGPSTWVPATHTEPQLEFLAPSSSLAKSRLSADIWEGNHRKYLFLLLSFLNTC